MPFSTRRINGGSHQVVTEKGMELKMSTSPEKRSESFAAPHLTHSASFLEQHPLTTHVPIPEEDEDETSSEPAEAITPTTDSHPPFTHHGVDGQIGFHIPPKLSIANTPASVKRRDTAPMSNKSLPTSNPTSQPSKPASKSLRALFRRSNSHAADQMAYNPLNVSSLTSTSPMAMTSSRRKPSYSASHSPATSQSNTPPSPSSPTSTVHSSSEKAWEPSALNKSVRSSTGLSLKISFGHTPKPSGIRKRSSSVNNFNHILPQRDDFSRPAETGAGLKARRMSISLPDDFIVDAVELDEEFTSASRLPGKRGKFIGKGATATVKLMTRKGAGDKVYAVKEFRKRGQNEDPEEYDKKVKSEYTIAKSLHHPNIVESVKLCTHAGRWNVVMEYCQQGELFSLVEKRYLEMDDKLCLWKQLLRGVNYLHNHGIAHRDIKLENLLMNDKGHLKITDFGVSDVFCGEHPGVREAGGECGKNMKEARRSAPGICGSLPYIAPEVLAKKSDYDPRPLDVWSCAIVMLSMMFNGGPWAEATKAQPTYAKFAAAWEDLEARRKEGGEDAIVPENPGKMFKAVTKPALRSLILRMLHPNPDKRIRIQEALNEGWVKMIDCCSFDGDEGQSVTEIDATKKCARAAKKTIAKSHHHLPPEKHWVPQHRFDMGDGWY